MRPQQLRSTDEGPSPVELVLAELSNCQETTNRLYAEMLGIPLDGLSVTMEGDLDLCGYFGEGGRASRLQRDTGGFVALDNPAGSDELQRLKKTVDKRCPILHMPSNPVPMGTVMGALAAAPTAE